MKNEIKYLVEQTTLDIDGYVTHVKREILSRFMKEKVPDLQGFGAKNTWQRTKIKKLTVFFLNTKCLITKTKK